MIEGPDFVWMHFPKSGGTALQAFLRARFSELPDVICDPIDPQNQIWHDSLTKRAERDETFNPSPKRIMCGIRRLPYWVLSHVHFAAGRKDERDPKVTRDMLVKGITSVEPCGPVTADMMLRSFQPHRVDRWVKNESMAGDLQTAFEGLRYAGKVKADAIPRVNETIIYRPIKRLNFWFTADELSGLYEANPYWAGLERLLYGNLLTIEA